MNVSTYSLQHIFFDRHWMTYAKLKASIGFQEIELHCKDRTVRDSGDDVLMSYRTMALSVAADAIIEVSVSMQKH